MYDDLMARAAGAGWTIDTSEPGVTRWHHRDGQTRVLLSRVVAMQWMRAELEREDAAVVGEPEAIELQEGVHNGRPYWWLPGGPEGWWNTREQALDFLAMWRRTTVPTV